MASNKFSKFNIRYLNSDKKIIFSYNALDEEKKCVLSIRPRADFDVHIPATFNGTCEGNFEGFPDTSEEITEEQFWRVFKSYTLSLFQYHQDQVAALSNK